MSQSRTPRPTKSATARPAGSSPAASTDPPRSRFRREPRGGLVLTERDDELLAALYQHRVMSRGQIQALFFTSVPRCNARLRQLFDGRYVARHFPPSAPFGAQALYLPGAGAAARIAARLDLDEGDVRRQCRTRTPLFLEHTLQIVQFYVDLRAAADQTDVRIERWLPEAPCRHEYDVRVPGGAWRREVFKPDGFVRLACAGTSGLHSYFLEIDLGHTSSRQFLGKLRLHRRYLESGLFREIFGGERFRTLVVTTGDRRMDNLRALAEAEGGDLFRFTTFGRLQAAGPLGPVWQAPGDVAPEGLLPGGPAAPGKVSGRREKKEK